MSLFIREKTCREYFKKLYSSNASRHEESNAWFWKRSEEQFFWSDKHARNKKCYECTKEWEVAEIYKIRGTIKNCRECVIEWLSIKDMLLSI